MRVCFCLLLLPLLLLPLPALSAPSASPAQLCESAISATEVTARLPARMMGAIALVESGRVDLTTGTTRPWPWTINAEGQGFFFATKQQAIDAVRALQVRGIQSIDVGCMQVNMMFHPRAFASLEEAFDPAANTRYAAQFLNALYAVRHDWPTAIAAYHSETPSIGTDYRERVMAHLDRSRLSRPLAHDADFTVRLERYRDFVPTNQVYGDFANAIDTRPTARPAPRGRPPARREAVVG